MKRYLVSILLFLLTLPVVQAQDFIRQIHVFHDDPHGPPIFQDVYVYQSQGQITSGEILGDAAIFQLYGMGVDPFNNIVPYKLDEKTVGTYFPVAEITIISQDEHYPPRTRADQPYQLRFSLTGLTDDPEAPPHARLAHLEQEFMLYDPATNVPYADGSHQHVYPGAFEFHANGEWLTPVVYQDLPGEDATKVRGEESFKFYAYPDDTGVRKQIASATIQIWPVSTALIIGLDPNRRYTSVPSSTRVELQDLYPRSITYVQVYPGQPVLGTLGYILPSTVISYNTFAPQAAMVTLDDLENGLGDDGIYTVEVLTVTPFNNGMPERLAYQTFNIDRTIQIRSTVTTID